MMERRVLQMSADAKNVEEVRVESIRCGNGEALCPTSGLELRQFVSQPCGARGFSTGTATFRSSAVLAYHEHTFSEAITILRGEALGAVQGRSYHLSAFDCIHVLAGVAHRVANRSQNSVMVALWAFASAAPSWQFVENEFEVRERGLANPEPDEAEHIVRFAQAETYELSTGAEFRDLFAGRLGSVGICGGYGRFKPEASLPCHIHKFDESITIVEGEAICLVQGKHYRLSGYDTAFVPEGRPHRFLNQSGTAMAMVWVYAGSEPERTIVDAAYCSGSLFWPGPKVLETLVTPDFHHRGRSAAR
jgi:quercetin dioxygenase-like cupin family protein